MRICMFLTDAFVGNDRGIVAAVRANAGTTRVFSFGIGNSVNRWLIDEMARAGRGESEIVTLAESADEAVARFTKRIQTPVLADVQVAFEGFEATAVTPSLIPDLFDVKPLVIHARYAAAGSGTVVVRGRTGAGPWERRIPVQLSGPGSGNAADMLPSLWARSQVDDALAPVLKELEQGSVPADLRRRVTSLGEGWQVMTPFTSFVAIEKARVTVGGRALLVPVPIELPQGTRFEGFFGEWRGGPVPMVQDQSRPVYGGGGEAAQTGDVLAQPSIGTAIVAGAAPQDTMGVPNLGEAVVPSTAPAPVATPGDPAGGAGGGRKDSVLRTRRLGGGDADGGSGGMVGGGGFGGGSKGKLGSMASRPAKPANAAPPQSTRPASGAASNSSMRELAPAGRAEVREAESLSRGQDAQAEAMHDAPTTALDDAGDPLPAVAPIEDPVTVLYDVRDLVGVGAEPAIVTQATDRLIRNLQTLTGRELWTDQGGRSAAWSAQDGLLRIEAWPSLHEMIDRALRTRRSAMAATGGIDRELVPAEAVQAITAMRARIARPLSATELERAWDQLGADLFRTALLGAAPAASSGTGPDGSVWVSVAVTEKSAIAALAGQFAQASVNEAARVVVGRVQPARLAELVQDPRVTAVTTMAAP
jgi:hypothetical protein